MEQWHLLNTFYNILNSLEGAAVILSYEIITRDKFLLENGSHAEDAMIIVLEGQFLCQTNGKQYTIRPNEIFFFKGGDRFQRKVLSPLNAIYIVLSPVFLSCNQKMHPLYPARAAENIQFLTHAIMDDNASLAEHYVQDLLYCCSSRKSESDPLILEVVDYMKENLTHNISLDQLASRFHISKQWLILRFKKELNTTPILYLNHLRMKTAKELLLQHNMTVGEVALASGFDNPYYFTNTFKKHFGMSPTAWRQTMVL